MTTAATATAATARAPGRRTRALLSRSAVNAALVLVAAYTLLPLAWLVLAATKSRRDLFATAPYSPGEFRLFANLAELFTYGDGIFGRWLGNSLLYTVVGSTASALISVACGYAFHAYEFRHKEALFGVVLAGVLVPATVLQLPLYLMASAMRRREHLRGVPDPRPRQPLRRVPGPGLRRGVRARRGAGRGAGRRCG